MAKKRASEGEYVEPDLVPIMNLVCVLIPLILWTTTWITFGQITIVRGAEGGASKGQQSNEQKKLRLVAIVTQNAITLMAGRDVANDVMPEDPSTGLKGRIDIPHLSISTSQATTNEQQCQAPTDPKEFNDCSYWSYVQKFLNICYEAPQGSVKIPDLKTLNLNLRAIKDRALDVYGRDRLDDIDQLNIKAEDDISYCQVVGVMDFARFRVYDYDWTADTEFQEHMNQLIAGGVNDPFLDPKQWNDAMKRELLFPVIGFVN